MSAKLNVSFVCCLKEPSIIFFDEIDGLAPVGSSKRDQIHASFASTLLTRGQAVVIGATNRPCLETFWPIRQRVLLSTARDGSRGEDSRIITKKWWEGEGDTRVKGLASLAKGYGGVDLRVCLLFYTLGGHHIN